MRRIALFRRLLAIGTAVTMLPQPVFGAPAQPTATPAQPSATTSSSASGALVPIIVKFRSGADADVTARRVAGRSGRKLDQLRTRVIEVPVASRDAVIASFSRERSVERVAPAVKMAKASIPNDPTYPDQWALPWIAWDQAYGVVPIPGAATIAVLDTGIDATHPDLAARMTTGQSFVGSNPSLDPNGHGTALAGIAAAVTGNATGVAGVAYAGASLSSVQVLRPDGTGWDSDVVSGVIWAADRGARVILMGFSSLGYSAALADAVTYARSKGAVLVAATGNDGSSAASYPAGLSGVIGVAATDQSDGLVPGSNTGSAVVGAPGVGIRTSQPGGGYGAISGTSAAAAHTAGLAALLVASGKSSSATASQIKGATDPITGRTFGRINVSKALGAAVAPPPSPTPAPTPTPGSTPTYVTAAAATFSTAISPGTAAISTSTTYTLTVTVFGGSSDQIQCVQVTVPTGMSTATGLSVLATDGGGQVRNWSISESGGVITTSAIGAEDRINPGTPPNGTVAITFTSTALSTGTKSYSTSAWNSSGCSAQASSSNPQTSSVVVPPTVTVSATDSSATEGADTGTFTVTRSTPGASDTLTVNYSLSGTATNGSDYSLPGSVNISGVSTTATIALTPTDDSSDETAETVILTLTSCSTTCTIGSPSSDTATINDNDPPEVSVSASDATATEAGTTTGAFTITRSQGDTFSSSLTVSYSFSGTATLGSSCTAGVDYTVSPSSTSVTLLASTATATITVTPCDDTSQESTESATLTLTANTGVYTITAASATVNITDDDTSVSVTASNGSESGPSNGSFTISRVGDTSGALNVSYTVSGSSTATSGASCTGSADYVQLSGSATIGAGSSSTTVTVTVCQDTLDEDAETAILDLAPGAGYQIVSPSSATVTISDDDPEPTLAINSPSAAEGNSGTSPLTFTVSLSAVSGRTVTVDYAPATARPRAAGLASEASTTSQCRPSRSPSRPEPRPAASPSPSAATPSTRPAKPSRSPCPAPATPPSAAAPGRARSPTTTPPPASRSTT